MARAIAAGWRNQTVFQKISSKMSFIYILVGIDLNMANAPMRTERPDASSRCPSLSQRKVRRDALPKLQTEHYILTHKHTLLCTGNTHTSGYRFIHKNTETATVRRPTGKSHLEPRTNAIVDLWSMYTHLHLQ